MSDTVNDPEHYRRMSEPFESPAEADAALAAFFDAVKQARDTYRIADVQVIVQVNIAHPGPRGERAGMASAYYGNVAANRLALLARSYGAAKAEHEEMLGDLIELGRQSVTVRR